MQWETKKKKKKIQTHSIFEVCLYIISRAPIYCLPEPICGSQGESKGSVKALLPWR